MGEAVRERAVLEDQAGIRDSKGRSLSRTDPAELERRYGPTATVHRAELLSVLRAAVPERSLRNGVAVSRVAQTGPWFTLAASPAPTWSWAPTAYAAWREPRSSRTPPPFGICLGPAETGLSLARCRRRVAGCQASTEPWARVRPISISTHPVRRLRQPPRRRRNRGAGVHRRTDLRSSCSRWRMSSSIKYGFMDIVLTIGHLPAGRARARASALARTMAGSRGSGGRTSRPGRWRRDGGLWIRIRFTVGHLLSRSCPSRPSASLRSSSGLVPRGTACVSAPGMGVTRKCAGGIFPFRPRASKLTFRAG